MVADALSRCNAEHALEFTAELGAMCVLPDHDDLRHQALEL
jgi:hypothetical protein